MDVILDTDFLLDALNWKIDIIGELKRILDVPFTLKIFDKTLAELKSKKNEKLALHYIHSTNICILSTDTELGVDELMLKLPKTALVATQDKALKKKLKAKGLKIVTIRQKKYLTFG